MIEILKSVAVTSVEVFVPNSTDNTLVAGVTCASADLYNHSGDNHITESASLTLSTYDNGDGSVSEKTINRFLIIQN